MKESPIHSKFAKNPRLPGVSANASLNEPAELKKINELICNCQIKTMGGQSFRTAWLAGLMREDGRRAYQIEDGLPLLLVESAIELSN